MKGGLGRTPVTLTTSPLSSSKLVGVMAAMTLRGAENSPAQEGKSGSSWPCVSGDAWVRLSVPAGAVFGRPFGVRASSGHDGEDISDRAASRTIAASKSGAAAEKVPGPVMANFARGLTAVVMIADVLLVILANRTIRAIRAIQWSAVPPFLLWCDFLIHASLKSASDNAETWIFCKVRDVEASTVMTASLPF